MGLLQSLRPFRVVVMTIRGQSGAGMLDLFQAGPRPYVVNVLPSMLVNGSMFKKFTSPTAFDAYVRELRTSGYSVVFASPFVATVEPRA